MQEDTTNSFNIPCTIWIRRKDGSWKGCIASSGGEITNAGKWLVSNCSRIEDVEKLVSKESIVSVEDQRKTEAADFTSRCKTSLMKMQAKENGTYCYVFDESEEVWYFGENVKNSLKELLKFIERN